MDGLRQYVFSVVAAALVCGILSGITSGSSAGSFMRILCGLAITLTLLRPLTQMQLPDWTEFLPAASQEGAQAAAQGEEMSREAMSAIIKEHYEAYILDKAKELGLEVWASVTVGEDLLPESARIGGDLTAQEKERFMAVLEKDLGISKENQLWTK